MAREYPGSDTYAWVLREFGSPTHFSTRVVNVDTTTQQILADNPRRVMWFITNAGVFDVQIGFEAALVYGRGLLLAANGGYASMLVSEDAEAVAYPVFAVASAGPTWLYIGEVYTV